MKNPPAITHSLAITSDETPKKKIDQLVDTNRFHDLTSLLHVTAFVTKFVRCSRIELVTKEVLQKKEHD